MALSANYSMTLQLQMPLPNVSFFPCFLIQIQSETVQYSLFSSGQNIWHQDMSQASSWSCREMAFGKFPTLSQVEQ